MAPPDPRDMRTHGGKILTGKEALERVKALSLDSRNYVLAWLVFNHPGSVEKAIAALEFNDMCAQEATQLQPAINGRTVTNGKTSEPGVPFRAP